MTHKRSVSKEMIKELLLSSDGHFNNSRKSVARFKSESCRGAYKLSVSSFTFRSGKWATKWARGCDRVLRNTNEQKKNGQVYMLYIKKILFT